VLGGGQVGLVSATCLASRGHDVTCLDVVPAVVARINAGDPHIHERGLPELVREMRSAGRLRARIAAPEALCDSDIVILAVPTPSVDGEIDLRHIKSSAQLVGAYLRGAHRYTSIVVKSTVVPGTTDTFVRQVLEDVSGIRLGAFGLGVNPEFLREGEAVKDFMHPDRIVIGYEDPETLIRLRELYASWSVERIEVNSRTAEMIKYANNCLLATQISAVNEIANVAGAIGRIDIQNVMRGVHLDRRWNPMAADGSRVRPAILTYLMPGCGFGGSCLPKDAEALRHQARLLGVKPRVLDAVLQVNADQPVQVVRLLQGSLGSLFGKRVLVLGLAFKPETDDVRDSAALAIIRHLVNHGAQVAAHDPIAVPQAQHALRSIPVEYPRVWTSALDSVDAVVVATRWPEYASLVTAENRSKLRGKLIVDARLMFGADQFSDTRYLSVGMGSPARAVHFPCPPLPHREHRGQHLPDTGAPGPRDALGEDPVQTTAARPRRPSGRRPEPLTPGVAPPKCAILLGESVQFRSPLTGRAAARLASSLVRFAPAAVAGDDRVVVSPTASGSKAPFQGP